MDLVLPGGKPGIKQPAAGNGQSGLNNQDHGDKTKSGVMPVGVILGLSVLGLYGFGFMLAALALIFKRVGPVATVLQYILLFITGAIIPLENFPVIIRTIGQTLPLSAGIKAMQMSVIERLPLAAIIRDPVFSNLLLSTVIYVFLGLTAFMVADRFARQKGLLGQY